MHRNDVENADSISILTEAYNKYTKGQLLNLQQIAEYANMKISRAYTLLRALNLKLLSRYESCCRSNLVTKGVKNVFELEAIQIKAHNTQRLNNNGKLAFNTDKQRNTVLKRYGASNVWSAKSTVRWKSSTPLVLNSILETKKKNKTFNTSKWENYMYIALKAIYPQVLRQYKSSQYPYAVDFYIPEIDTYIELQLHWTHGGKPFNSEDPKDKEKLKIWKEKALHSKYYKNAINVWTQLDVAKRLTAVAGSLNYVEIFTIQNMHEYLNKERKR